MKNLKEALTEFITIFIIAIIICLLLCVSCKHHKNIIVDDNYEYDNTVQTATMMHYEYMYTQQQLDSALVADELPTSLGDWVGAAYVDYETKKASNQYLYYKTNYNNEVYVIYKISVIRNNNDITYIYEIRYISNY